ncbi:aminotransferase class III-fold pyridoxal phosphate-dependent enzyme, partial [Citrobacter sp. AAK_AS5]
QRGRRSAQHEARVEGEVAFRQFAAERIEDAHQLVVRAVAQRLAEHLGGSLQRAFFVNSGSEANEGAVLLSRLYTGKPGVIALDGGLHGRTALTMGLTGLELWRTDPFPPPHLYRVPHPHCAA